MNRKRLSALFMAMTFTAGTLSACSNDKRERNSGTESLPTSYALETRSVETPSPTQAPAATATPSPIPTDSPTPVPTSAPAIDPASIGDSTVYNELMAYAEQVHQEDPEATFSLTRGYGEGSWYWGLWVHEADGYSVEHRVVNGNVVGSGDVNPYYEGASLSYDQLQRLPTLCETYAFSYSDEDLIIADSVPDGVYFGEIEAIKADGSEAFLVIGDCITISRDQLDQYEVGDTFHIDELDYDFVISNIDESYGISTDYDDFWFSEGYSRYLPDSDRLMLMTSSENPIVVNSRLALLPFAPDCQITDTFAILSGRDTPNPSLFGENILTESYYWTYLLQDDYEDSLEIRSALSNNGYIAAIGLAYPVVVENGQIVLMNVEWR